VLCPANTDAEIDRKLREFFDAKCQLAWVIDPATKTAKVYTSATAFTELTEAGALDGFALALKDVFAAPERK
jgi:Uma2 family endonuclease